MFTNIISTKMTVIFYKETKRVSCQPKYTMFRIKRQGWKNSNPVGKDWSKIQNKNFSQQAPFLIQSISIKFSLDNSGCRVLEYLFVFVTFFVRIFVIPFSIVSLSRSFKYLHYLSASSALSSRFFPSPILPVGVVIRLFSFSESRSTSSTFLDGVLVCPIAFVSLVPSFLFSPTIEQLQQSKSYTILHLRPTLR